MPRMQTRKCTTVVWELEYQSALGTERKMFRTSVVCLPLCKAEYLLLIDTEVEHSIRGSTLYDLGMT